jgi:dTDP-4-dehydrorhamnose 3,5-epimerase
MNSIQGGTYADDRGVLRFVNDFDFAKVKRFYQVENFSKGFVRAWHGHLQEEKYVYVTKGSILLGAVDLETNEVKKVVVSSHSPKVVHIPSNHANGFKTLEDDTIIMFFSTSTLEESKGDDIRFNWDKWNIWEDDYR